MKIAVLSGKGGAGKTFVSVNLAVAAGKSTYIDCDVEEPNGRLFLKPQGLSTQAVFTTQPAIDGDKCIGCRKCVEFCRFNALVFVKKKPLVFPEVCHSCGLCSLVCPAGAICDEQRQVGVVESGHYGDITVITGELNPGESSSIPVEQAAMQLGFSSGDDTVVIDCPPGSACSVMESVEEADYCVLVAEPTAFGLHNLEMVYELVNILSKPCGVVINKQDAPYPPLEDFFTERGVHVLERLPYDWDIARLTSQGEIASEHLPAVREKFRKLLDTIRQEVGA